jgi:hypothetical protein
MISQLPESVLDLHLDTDSIRIRDTDDHRLDRFGIGDVEMERIALRPVVGIPTGC